MAETVYNSKNTLTVGAFSFTSVSAPTITASGPPAADANALTVIGSSTTGNVVQFSNTAGGTFIMTNAGRVGIGTTNPVYAMDITGDLNFTGTFRQNGTPYVGSQWTGTSSIYFLGNVGIGTASPATALDVYTGTMNAATVSATTLTGAGSGITSLNMGNAGSGTLALARGGTGTTSAQLAMNALAGAVTNAQYLRGNGTNVVMAAISASDVPTLNQNTSGTAAGLSTTLAVASGGTGVTSSTGTGSVVLSASPTLTGTVTAATVSATTLTGAGSGITSLNMGNAGSGTLAVARGGTGVISSTGTGSVVLSAGPTFTGTVTAATGYFSGNLGLGTASPGFPLHVTATGVATSSSAYSNLAFQTGGWYQAHNAAGTRTLKIYTDGNIGCAELDLFSDERIKKDIEDVSEADASLLVSELRPRTFRYTDAIEYGPVRVNGLIAQEVLKVVPSAVSTHKGVVPDVFKSGKVSVDWITVEGVFEVGEVLKVLDGDEVHMVAVVDVRGGAVRVDKTLKGAEVFVYGHEVQDFHTVSYERIVPLLISTIQSLQKRVAILENKSQ